MPWNTKGHDKGNSYQRCNLLRFWISWEQRQQSLSTDGKQENLHTNPSHIFPQTTLYLQCFNRKISFRLNNFLSWRKSVWISAQAIFLSLFHPRWSGCPEPFPEESHLRYKNKPERCEVNQLPQTEYLLSVITHAVCCSTLYWEKKNQQRIQCCIAPSLVLTVRVERFIDVINDKLVAYVRLWTWTKHCFSWSWRQK